MDNWSTAKLFSRQTGSGYILWIYRNLLILLQICDILRLCNKVHAQNMDTKITADGKTVDTSLLRGTNRLQGAKQENVKEIKHALTGEGFNDYREIFLMKVLKPTYICAKIFGLLWKNEYNMFHGKRCSFDLCKLHCCVVLFSVWFFFVRYFALYESTDRYGSELFRKISFQLIDMQIASGITCNVYFIQRHAPSFIKLWENYKIRHGGVPFARMKRNIVIIMISINLFTLIVPSIFNVIGLITEPQIFIDYHLPLMKRMNLPTPFWLTVLATFYYLYLAMAWLQSLLYCLCMNKNLAEEFKQLTTQLSREVEGTDTVSAGQPKMQQSQDSYKTEFVIATDVKNKVEPFRLRYMELCTLVSKFDDVISSYLLSIYLFSIPAIVIFTYQLLGLKDESSTESMALYFSNISMVIFYVAILISVTASSSSLTSAAQKVKGVLYIINLTKCSQEEGTSLQLFLHKISSDHIGLTIWKFVNIDKRMLITIFTIVVTYITILLKFALALGKVSVIEDTTDCPCMNQTIQTP